MASLVTAEQLYGAYASVREQIAALDNERRAVEVDDVRVLVASGWADAGKAARAVDYLGRELRRVAGAWDHAYERSGDVLDETVFARPDWMLEMLDERRGPASDARAGLELCFARARPLTLMSVPHDLMWAALAEWPALTAAVATASLGWTVHIDVVRGCSLGVEPDAPDEERARRVARSLLSLPRGRTHHTFEMCPPARGRYSTIHVGQPHDALHLVVHRVTDAGEDLVRVSTRHLP